MELSGNLPSQSDKQTLWDTLMSTEAWKESIPDAEKYEQIGENLYEMAVKADIGPIKGTQTIKIQFNELVPPDSLQFDLQHSLVKTAKGTFLLEDPKNPNPDGDAWVVGDEVKTMLVYKLEADAGNPIFNAILESMKGKIKEGFEELLGQVVAKAQTA